MRLTRSTAAEIAAHIRAAGIPVSEVSEPNDVEDGMIVITPTLHVQVPLNGAEGPNLVQQDDDTFCFGESRATLDALLADIKAATTN